MGTAPLAMVDGILHVGLTSLEGDEPAVWMDGEIRKLGFNGYISSLSVWKPSLPGTDQKFFEPFGMITPADPPMKQCGTGQDLP